MDYEGAAFYEKEFTTSGGCLRLVFDGVLTHARVFLDGVLLGEHTGGFTRFSFLVPGVGAGRHRLSVIADNRFYADSIPQKKVDWYHWGGIIRSVWVEELQGITVLSAHLVYTLNEDLTAAKAHFALTLYNAADAPVTDTVTAELDGKETARLSLTLAPHETREAVTKEFTVDGVRLWSPEAPELYTMTLRTGSDDLIDRTGFRLVEVRERQILLNHRPVEFRGVNRHEEHPDFGFSVEMFCDMAADKSGSACNQDSHLFCSFRMEFIRFIMASFWLSMERTSWNCERARSRLWPGR